MIDLDPRPLNNIISLISRHYYAREGYLIIPSAYTTVTQYQQLVISDFFTINLNSIITMICLKLEVYCSNGNRPFCWNCKLRFIEKQIKQYNMGNRNSDCWLMIFSCSLYYPSSEFSSMKTINLYLLDTITVTINGFLIWMSLWTEY